MEHEPLTLLLDLILLKPRVFLHLLFNRRSPAYDATAGKAAGHDPDREGRIRRDVSVLFATVVAAETLVRVLPLMDQTSAGIIPSVLSALGSVVVETVCQHALTLGLTLVILRWRGWYPFTASQGVSSSDGRQLDFMCVWRETVKYG